MALTDPKWTCTDDTGAGGTNMSLVATAPKYGWTDLLYSLVPTGRTSRSPGTCRRSTAATRARAARRQSLPEPVTPVGIPKQSIVTALYASGKTGIPPARAHTTFPPKIDKAITCLQGAYPPEPTRSARRRISTLLPEFLRERSAYYQNGFFSKIAADAELPGAGLQRRAPSPTRCSRRPRTGGC